MPARRTWTAEVRIDRCFLHEPRTMRLLVIREVERELPATKVEVARFEVLPTPEGEPLLKIAASGSAVPVSARQLAERRRMATGARRGFLRGRGSRPQ